MKRILVIDDDTNVRDTFALALERCGYTVVTAPNGPAGIESAAYDRPGLIFLDLKMPGMTGVETLSRLHDIIPGVPVYIVTAFYGEFLQPLKELQARGISFDVARKPLTLEEIRAIADAVLGGAQHTQEG
jgi:CheY-like chemotaxis protein